MLGKIVNKLIYPFNLKVSKIVNNNPNSIYPIEATKRDKEIIDYILKPKDKRSAPNKDALSMVSVDRLWAVMQATRYIVKNNIEGDLVECGVWRGGCSLAIAMILDELKSNKKIYLFDTFAGMTEPGGNDKNCDEVDAKIKFFKSNKTNYNSWCYASIEDVKNQFQKLNLTQKAVFIKGDILKTLKLKTNIPKKISLLRLDTDWYESTKYELKILFPILQKDGVLLIDDYGHWKGARKAVDEYSEENEFFNKCLIWKTDFTGRSLIKK